MSAIGKGDWVQCVDDSPACPGYEFPRPFIRKGGVYCVERVLPGELFESNQDAFELVGVEGCDPDGDRAAFLIWRFKPLGGGVSIPRISAELTDA